MTPTATEWYELRQLVEAATKKAKELKAKYPHCPYVKRSVHGLETDRGEISDRYCHEKLEEEAKMTEIRELAEVF